MSRLGQKVDTEVKRQAGPKEKTNPGLLGACPALNRLVQDLGPHAGNYCQCINELEKCKRMNRPAFYNTEALTKLHLWHWILALDGGAPEPSNFLRLGIRQISQPNLLASSKVLC